MTPKTKLRQITKKITSLKAESLISRLNSALPLKLPTYLGLFIFTAMMISLLFRLIVFYPQILYLAQTNITPTSTTLAWFSSHPAKGCAYLLTFPPRRLCDTHGSLVNNHHLTLDQLHPGRRYPLLLQTGPHLQLIHLDPRFIPEDQPGLPNPAYGQILFHPLNPQPVTQATVIAQTPQGIISTMTNQQGRFSLDIGQIPPKTLIRLTLQWGGHQTTNRFLIVGEHQPLPTLYLSNLKLSHHPAAALINFQSSN